MISDFDACCKTRSRFDVPVPAGCFQQHARFESARARFQFGSQVCRGGSMRMVLGMVVLSSYASLPLDHLRTRADLALNPTPKPSLVLVGTPCDDDYDNTEGDKLHRDLRFTQW